MKTIYKYPLTDLLNLPVLPPGAEPFCVQFQNGVPTLWALVDKNPNDTAEPVHLVIVGTAEGHEFDDEHLEYVDTFQTGAFVWHLFVVRP
jgi:hypothetical protein